MNRRRKILVAVTNSFLREKIKKIVDSDLLYISFQKPLVFFRVSEKVFAFDFKVEDCIKQIKIQASFFKVNKNYGLKKISIIPTYNVSIPFLTEFKSTEDFLNFKDNNIDKYNEKFKNAIIDYLVSTEDFKDWIQDSFNMFETVIKNIKN